MDLQISGLTKKFQDIAAVDCVSFTLSYGVYGLLGVNGAGKTTLMRMLCTLIKPSAGFITWNGEDIFTMDHRYRKLLGYLPQDFGYYPDFTVYDYLMYIASIKGIRPVVAKKRIEMLLEQVELIKQKNKKMKKLSGGMKRRVGIAQAMINDPKILILDEPTVGLDPNERIRFRNLISELSSKRLVLLSTHIVSDIEYIANEILLMKDGRIVMSGDPEALIASMPKQAWRCEVSREQVASYRKAYQVANIKTTSKGAELRILSEKPPAENAVLETVSLEDVFLYYFGGKEGAEDGTI